MKEFFENKNEAAMAETKIINPLKGGFKIKVNLVL